MTLENKHYTTSKSKNGEELQIISINTTVDNVSGEASHYIYSIDNKGELHCELRGNETKIPNDYGRPN